MVVVVVSLCFGIKGIEALEPDSIKAFFSKGSAAVRLSSCCCCCCLCVLYTTALRISILQYLHIITSFEYMNVLGSGFCSEMYDRKHVSVLPSLSLWLARLSLLLLLSTFFFFCEITWFLILGPFFVICLFFSTSFSPFSR